MDSHASLASCELGDLKARNTIRMGVVGVELGQNDKSFKDVTPWNKQSTVFSNLLTINPWDRGGVPKLNMSNTSEEFQIVLLYHIRTLLLSTSHITDKRRWPCYYTFIMKNLYKGSGLIINLRARRFFAHSKQCCKGWWTISFSVKRYNYIPLNPIWYVDRMCCFTHWGILLIYWAGDVFL